MVTEAESEHRAKPNVIRQGRRQTREMCVVRWCGYDVEERDSDDFTSHHMLGSGRISMTARAAGRVDGVCWVCFESLQSFWLGPQKYRVLWVIVEVVIGWFECGRHDAA